MFGSEKTCGRIELIQGNALAPVLRYGKGTEMKKLAVCFLALLLMISASACETGKNPTESETGTESETLDPMYDGIETGLPIDGNEKAFWKLDGDVMTLFGEGALDAASASHFPWRGVEDYVRHIVISEQITYVGAYALYGIETLLDVTFENGGPTTLGLACIGDNRNLRSVDLGDSLTELPMELFVRCYGLEEVTIPVTVTKIGSYAFDQCESLKTIRYEGTEEEWKQIEIAAGNDFLLQATVIYNCTDGEDSAQ